MGLILTGQIDDGRVYLQAIAFGERHPTATSRPSVCHLAHRRLFARGQTPLTGPDPKLRHGVDQTTDKSPSDTEARWGNLRV